METRQLGRSGLTVSAVGLGCNNFGRKLDPAQTKAVVHAALDLGITHFDIADVYGGRGTSEDYLGQAMGARRKDIVLGTKFGQPMDDAGRLKGGSRRYVMQAVEASLTRLRTDYLDIYHLHSPDPVTPIEETLRALDDLVRQGKVRYLGNSNFAAWQIADADATARHIGVTPFVSAQNHYSLLWRDAERELLPSVRAHGLGLLPYYPLASGLLTGKYRPGAPAPAGSRLSGEVNPLHRRFLGERQAAVAERLRVFAEARGHSLLELAFSWLLQQDGVASVIAGATSADQLKGNAAAIGWRLAPEELAEVDEITR